MATSGKKISHLQDVDGIFSGAQLALQDAASLTTAALQWMRLCEVDVLPVVGHIAAVAAPQLQVPPEVLSFGLEPGARLHLGPDLESDLHHDETRRRKRNKLRKIC